MKFGPGLWVKARGSNCLSGPGQPGLTRRHRPRHKPNPKCYGGVQFRERETLKHQGDSILGGERRVLRTKNATLLLSVVVQQDWRLQVL
jgi:hypothetical protein